jgi:hypothetical protein
MILLDTDMLTLLLQRNPRVEKRMRSAEPDDATTIVTWMEVMQGRFRSIFAASMWSQSAERPGRNGSHSLFTRIRENQAGLRCAAG